MCASYVFMVMNKILKIFSAVLFGDINPCFENTRFITPDKRIFRGKPWGILRAGRDIDKRASGQPVRAWIQEKR
jgi:hypothetical protein